MSTFSFSQLNLYIKEVIPPLLDELQGEQFHYLKIAQHALVYHYQKNLQKILPNRLSKPVFAQKLVYKMKSVKHKPALPPKLKATVLFDSGRTFTNNSGKAVSVYFKTFLEAGKTEDITHLVVPNGDKNAPCDVHLKNHPKLASFPLEKAEVKLLKEIQSVLKKLSESKALPNESFDQISSAFHRFFEEFHYYFQLLKNQEVERVFATNHYHQEGLIAACRTLGIKFIEIQHGLISLNDLYYVYDQHILPKGDLKNAFFPDQVVLYGEFWKGLLKRGGEHRNSELTVLGDYVYKQKKVEDYTAEKRNEIFIGAQKTCQSLM